MNAFLFSKYNPNDGKSRFEQLLDIFMQLLTYTSGELSEALSWMNELDKKYQLTDDEYGMGDFIEDLKENYSEDHLENNLRLTINKIYPIDKTSHVVNKILPDIKDLKYRGLCFYPEFSETKLIFMFNNDKNDKNDKNIFIKEINKEIIKERKKSRQEIKREDKE